MSVKIGLSTVFFSAMLLSVARSQMATVPESATAVDRADPGASAEVSSGDRSITQPASDAGVASEEPELTLNAVREFSRADNRMTEQQVHQAICRDLNPAILVPRGESKSLASVLDILASHLTSRGTQILIALDESDPDIGEDPDFLHNTEIQGINLPEGFVTVEEALRQIFSKVKDQELSWFVRGRLLLVTTAASEEEEGNLLLRSYDISRLRKLTLAPRPVHGTKTGEPSGAPGGLGGGGAFQVNSSETGTFGMPMPGMLMPGMLMPGMVSTGGPVGASEWERAFMDTIQNMTSPPTLWKENGDEIGTLAIVGDRLLVCNSRSAQQQVVAVLEELERAVIDAAAQRAVKAPSEGPRY